MKKNSTALLMALALAWPAMNLPAQDADKPKPPREQRFQPGDGNAPDGPREGQRPPRFRPPEGGQPGQPMQDGQRPPAPPLLAALDTDGDGTISEKEISSASKSLKKLDKNKDGKLTMDELRPAGGMRPPHGGNFGPEGANGPRPPRDGNFGAEGNRPPPRRGDGFRREGFRPDGPPPGEGEGAPRRDPPPRDGLQ